MLESLMRARLIGVFLVVIAALIAVALLLNGRVGSSLVVRAEEKVKAGNEVVRLANRVDDYSLLQTVRELSELPGLADSLRCPMTDEALRDATREQVQAVKADGTPLTDDLGRAIGTDGKVIQPKTACTETSHVTALRLLRDWSEAEKPGRLENQGRFLSEREPGQAISREPDVLLVTDAAGVVVARAGFDKDDWFGPSKAKMKEFPVVGRTEAYGPQHDVIVWRENPGDKPSLAQVASAPVFRTANGERTYVGSVLIGFFVTNEAADEDRQLLEGMDVAYFMGDQGQISFAGSSVEDPALLSSLASASYRERTDAAAAEVSFAEMSTKGLGAMFETTLNGRQYLVMPAGFSQGRADASSQVGFLVLGSVTDARAPVAAVARTLPIVGLVLFLLAVVLIVVVSKQFMEPIEEISKGIQEVIAGRVDYMWPVEEKSYLSDLSHSLNIMSAKLQGKSDPDSEDAAGAAEWAGMVGGPTTGQNGAAPKGVAGLGGIRGRRSQESDGE
jgi:hypothetical protein